MNNLIKNLIYWVPTILIAALWSYGGTTALLKVPSSMEVFQRLGYPEYFSVLLGTAQLLGAFAILAPVPNTIREWAYAGMTFDVSSAIFSILSIGSPIFHATIPFLVLLLVITSYKAWRSRIGSGQVLENAR